MESIVTEHVEAYVYQKAKSGNQESGDTYFIHTEEDYFICAIADGLGNGPIARQSSQIIPKVLVEHHHETVDELLSRCNEHMFRKRGAAVAIVKIDYRQKKVRYSCVGNVRFYMLQDRVKMIYPLPVMGYLSGRPQRLKMQEYEYHPGDLFFLHSDGVALTSPKALLIGSSGSYELYRNVLQTIKYGDDATFIAGNLLL
ncbi:PP2C family serine/threonine-protein phosphatase [Sporosarcina limicola]|uniref:Negative regulator of sigma-B (Phosphoserine phosphatase) n=1 Tax=Sporosarcina limicola TaxID=34101 RepID=A0A927MPX4_9BACL|nr:PP2C family serine/threonine-protein phosphatase [Sporosarcina limicola]MBE1555206.1 negative regulator of sigma-B (phosphoserine phosphatase) [Sporosarcina limicola]